MSNCIVFRNAETRRDFSLRISWDHLSSSGRSKMRRVVLSPIQNDPKDVDAHIRRYYLPDATFDKVGVTIRFNEKDGRPRFTNRSFDWFLLWLRPLTVQDRKLSFTVQIQDTDFGEDRWFTEKVDISYRPEVTLTCLSTQTVSTV